MERYRKRRLNPRFVILCAVLAALDEFHQLFVPGRDGKLSDVLIDTCGAVCFLLFSLALSALQRAKEERNGLNQ